MLPNIDVTTEWTAKAGGTASYFNVDNDDGNTDYAYVSGASASGKSLIFELESPSVTEVDIDWSIGITVTIKASMSKTLSGNSYVKLVQAGTAADASPITGTTATKTVIAGGYALYSGTTEATSDGSDVWVYGDLVHLQIKAEKFRNDRFGQLRLSYFYAEVSYVPTTSATFFGANF